MPPRHLTSHAQALYTTFIAPVLHTANRSLLVPSPRPRPALASRCMLRPHPSRPIYVYAKQTRATAYDDPDHPLDEKIGAAAHLVDTSTNALGDLLPITALLAAIDRRKEHLRRVDVAPDGAPICKVISRSALLEEFRARQKRRVRQKSGGLENVKQVELTWAMTEHDLGYRLRKIEEFLREGKKVECMIGPKKGGRRATVGEAEDLVGDLRKGIGAFQGLVTDEVKEMEGQLRRQVVLTFMAREGAVDKEEKGREASAARVERIEARHKEKEERRLKNERRIEEKRKEEERRREELSRLRAAARA